MSIETKKQRMEKLVKMLNQAAKAYYQDAAEIMSNYEYDALYDELENLEKELGLTLSDSPTVRVGYEVLSELPKERHESPMLSLDKTKEIESLKEFLGNQKALISWKLDGLTMCLRIVMVSFIRQLPVGTERLEKSLRIMRRYLKICR